jgi:hypothetical protein
MTRAYYFRSTLLLALAPMLFACSASRQIAFSPITQSKSETPGFTLHYQNYALPSARPEYNTITVSELTEQCKSTPDSCPVVWKVALDARKSPQHLFYGQTLPSGVVETPAAKLAEGKLYRLVVNNETFAGVLDHGAVRFSLKSTHQ